MKRSTLLGLLLSLSFCAACENSSAPPRGWVQVANSTASDAQSTTLSATFGDLDARQEAEGFFSGCTRAEAGSCVFIECDTDETTTVTRKSAGMLSMTVGGAATIAGQLEQGLYYGMASSPVASGADVTIRAEGANFPAFEAVVRMPDAPAVSLPGAITRGQDLVLMLGAASAADEVYGVLSATAGSTQMILRCASSGSSITLPATYIDMYPEAEATLAVVHRNSAQTAANSETVLIAADNARTTTIPIQD